MIRYLFIAAFIASIPADALSAQDSISQKATLSGYLSFTWNAMHINIPESIWYHEGLFHNRLNFYYYPIENLSFSVQVRNRFLLSDRLRNDRFNSYRNSVSSDGGIVDLSWSPVSGKSFLFNSTVDRLWVTYSRDKFEITAGRQRINWGLSYVWNSNDWFNNYSFFDVDYPERPGSDAIRLRYFTGALSSAEAVVKLDSNSQITAAGLFKLNARAYDMQILLGILSAEDAALGFGWAGGIGQIGFRGEMSYIHPLKNWTDTSGLFLISAALDYTFSNSLMIQLEGFYNQRPEGIEESFSDFYTRPSSVKDLSFTEFNFFAQVSYPFTPLFNGSVAALFFPRVKGYYLGPSLTYSLGNNLELALFVQYFKGEFPLIPGFKTKQEMFMGFGRVKWSF